MTVEKEKKFIMPLFKKKKMRKECRAEGIEDKWLDANIPSEGYLSRVERREKYLETDR